jgi:uncharacterized membrane protein YczE
MKAKINTINSIKYIFGLLFLSFSVVLTFRTGFGASPADTLTVIIAHTANITKGLAAFLITSTIITFLTIYFRKVVFLILFLQILAFSALIDLWDLVVLGNYFPSGFEVIIPFIASILMMPLGCVFLIRSTYPAGVYDELMFFTSKVTKFRPFVARTLNEITLVSLALVISFSTGNQFGAVNWGTFVYALTLGTFIKIYIQFLDYMKIRRESHEH